MRDYLFLNQQDIEEIRQKIESYDWARDLYEKIKNDTTFAAMSKDEVSETVRAMSYILEEGRWLKQKSLVYAVSGDDRDIPLLIEALERRFFEPWGFDLLIFQITATVPFDLEYLKDYWTLWLHLANHTLAFTLIKDHPSFGAARIARFERRFRQILTAKKINYREIVSLYNCQFWDVACMGVLGILLEDEEAVDLALNGRFGFKHLLDKFYDGLFWPEATIYAFHYISSCALMLAEACLKNGYENLYQYVSPSGASLKTMFDGWIRCLFADGRIATCGALSQQPAVVSALEKNTTYDVNDAFLFNNEGYRDANKIEMAYRAYKDPTYAWIIAQNPKRDSWDHIFWGYSALTHGIPLETIEPPSAASCVFKQYGAAMIRSDETAKYWNSAAIAVFVRDGSRQGHSQSDHSNILLNAFNKNIYPDWHTLWDYHPPQDPRTGESRNRTGFNSSIAGHNTVAVDGKDAELHQVRILPLKRINGMQVLTVISGTDGGAYRGVYQIRTLGVTREYVLDIFDLRSRDQHCYDYLLHGFGALSAEGLADVEPCNLEEIRNEYGLHEIDTMAESEDNVWIRPGHRGHTRGDWKATFVDTDEIGSTAHFLKGEDTEVFLTNTPYYVSSYGWDDKPVDGIVRRIPLLLARRRADRTTFTVVHQPFAAVPAALKLEMEGRILRIRGKGFRDEIDVETMAYERRPVN